MIRLGKTQINLLNSYYWITRTTLSITMHSCTYIKIFWGMYLDRRIDKYMDREVDGQRGRWKDKYTNTR